MPTTTPHRLKKNDFRCWNLNHWNLFSLFKSHLVVQIWTVKYVKYFVNIQEVYLVEHFFKKIATLISLAVNSAANTFPQILQYCGLKILKKNLKNPNKKWVKCCMKAPVRQVLLKTSLFEVHSSKRYLKTPWWTF